MKETLLMIALLFLPLGCVLTNVEGPPDVAGTWFMENRFEIPGGAPTDTVFLIDRLEMTFGEDFTLQKRRVVLDELTRAQLGYRYVSEGTYSTTGLHLTMIEEMRGVHSDTAGIFSPTLIPVAITPSTEVVTYSVEGEAIVFRYPPCPPGADCMEFQTLFKTTE